MFSSFGRAVGGAAGMYKAYCRHCHHNGKNNVNGKNDGYDRNYSTTGEA